MHELVGGQSQSVHLLAASMVAAQLTSLDGFEVPSWPALAAGDRPPPEERRGFRARRSTWRWAARGRSQGGQFREQDLMPRLAEDDRALLRSQSGPLAGMSFSTVPARIDSQAFRVLLLRLLRLPLPLSSRRCRCGRFLGDCRGSGQTRVCGRECCCTNLPRGRRQGVH